MIRILFYLAIVFALGLGFAWLADRPGDMVVTFSGYQYKVSLMVAAVAITAIVAAVMLSWWLTKAVWNSPFTIARHFRVRRRDRGYQALSTGMIAAGAGDAALARKKNKEAAKLINLDQEPLILLLDAQASLLEGDHDTARQKFEAMLDDPEMHLLGLRGLYLEAERLGDRAAARHYAGRAAGLAPQLGWAADSTLEEKCERGDWDGALALIDAQKSTRQIERGVANNKRAVLLTAKAMSLFEGDFNAARTAALEANRLRPDFGPAAAIAARTLFRQNDVRKGSKVLETAWKAAPLPNIAELYVHGRPSDAVLDRLARAKKLQSLKQNHPESSLAVARAALEAQDYKLARSEAEAAARMQPRERAYLLLADIEEAQSSDPGKVRQWLSRAVRAPRDPAWVADGVVSERWAPFSPVTGRLDAFEWKAPEERLGHLIEQDDEPAERVSILSIPAAQPAGEAIVDVIVEDEVVPETAAAQPVPARAVPPATDGATLTDDDKAEPIRLPDDPSVDPEVERENAQKRFRLF